MNFKKINLYMNHKDIYNKGICYNGIKILNKITDGCNCYYWLDNTFTAFKSINNILYLVYSNPKRSIVSYNLINNKKINEIKEAHNEQITNIRNYFDEINHRDLILSISANDNNIRIWDVKNWDCISNIKNINKNGRLYSASFLNDNHHQIYIISSNINWDKFQVIELIKVFDLKGREIKKINDSDYTTFFIDSFYSEKFSKNFIITGNSDEINSYDFKENKRYKTYIDNEKAIDDDHYSIIIFNKEKEKVELIDSSCNGIIRIWDFYSGSLINKFIASRSWIKGICLWDNDSLFVGCLDNSLKLIDLKSGNIIQNIKDLKDCVLTIKKIEHPKYGKCLITQGIKEITIWNKDFKLVLK